MSSRIHGTAVMVALLLSGCSQTESGNDAPPGNSPNGYLVDGQATDINLWPKMGSPLQQDDALEQQVENLLATMTLEQKVAQMIQPEIRDITPEEMREYGFGSYLNGGGSFPDGNKHATAQDWIDLAEAMYQASIDDSLDGIAIPTMWGTDAVHGHNNVIGATLFPHNIGLGAARNPDLIRDIAAVTAREVMVTGIDWVFAPTVAVAMDERWGRTYESYSEDPALVRDYSAAIVEGLQGAVDDDFLSDQRVIATVKHFVGDGGTEGGDDQGDSLVSEQELIEVHGQGYVGGLGAGAQTVMASFNSWHGKKNHGNAYLMTDVLKARMGFDGLVVGDWNGHGQVAGCSNESCPQAVNAGLDIYMVPTDAWKPLYHNTIAQVQSGEIAQERIDDAVRRILRVKFRAGLFDKPSPAQRPLSGKTELIGSAEHRAVARQAVRESLVLIKNNDDLLPLDGSQKVLVAGDGADNIGKQSGGWTITWQGTGNQNSDFPGGTSIYQGIAEAVAAAGGETQLSVQGEWQGDDRPDVALVVFGEEPYAEGNGDVANLEYQRGQKRDLALLKRLQAEGIPVISVFLTGRPLWVNPELNASDAFVVAWLPGSEGAGVADVLVRDPQGQVRHDFTGTLPFSWPNAVDDNVAMRQQADNAPLLPVGFGLKAGQASTLANNLSEDNGQDPSQLASLVLFEQSAKSPWQMALGQWGENGPSTAPIRSSQQSNAAVTISTQDRDVQEDTRLLAFTGEGTGWAMLGTNFAEDLRAHIEAGSALTVELHAAAPLTGPVQLGMVCESGAECWAQVEIQPAIDALSQQWGTVSVDLACFAQQGIDFGNVTSPFLLASGTEQQVSFGKVALVPQQAQSADVRCETP
ncbi:glycoside hydrolase family 3 protein [Ferrimonas marina]|uniref:Beta-glucosidase n=1 Tax=Ferrimonas marina TaxID=299255 RepID=A0A1M5YW24_9GAMM|nr:exo 1,3/1,4-beta-D-glucan glucohydrolase [Ferrimonas marina]SHI16221.1 beta-glucosidase [Ferrimonas marina]